MIDYTDSVDHVFKTSVKKEVKNKKSYFVLDVINNIKRCSTIMIKNKYDIIKRCTTRTK